MPRHLIPCDCTAVGDTARSTHASASPIASDRASILCRLVFVCMPGCLLLPLPRVGLQKRRQRVRMISLCHVCPPMVRWQWSSRSSNNSFPRFSDGGVTKNLPGQKGRSRHCAVLSETVATVSLTAAPIIVCSEQLAHSRTAGSILKLRHLPAARYRISINNPSFDTDRYSPLASRWHVIKTLPQTGLQIHVTVTTLNIVSFLHYFPPCNA